MRWVIFARCMLWERKEFLRWNKKFFSSFLKGLHKANEQIFLEGDSSTLIRTRSKTRKFRNFFSKFFESEVFEFLICHPFSSFLKNRNFNSILLTPTTTEEVAKVIGSFSASKSVGPNSIPVRILKLLKQDISGPIKEL